MGFLIDGYEPSTVADTHTYRPEQESVALGMKRPALGRSSSLRAADHEARRWLKNERISSRAAIFGWPAWSIRWAVTTLRGVGTYFSKNWEVSRLAALSGSTRGMNRSPSASE